MFKKRDSGFFSNLRVPIAIMTLVGTAVGAGMLGIPYVVAKAGFLYGLILLLVLGVAFVYLHLFAGEVVLRTKGIHHQLTGYAEKYLGPNGKRVMTLALFINIYGALTAYLIGEGITLHSIFNYSSPLLYSLLFFLLGVFIIYRGIKTLGRVELILISLLLLIIVGVGIFSYDHIDYSNLQGFNPAYFFLPYGVILFAYMASPAIPEMHEVLGPAKNKMKKAILIGGFIPVIIYIMFTFIVVGIVGWENFSVLGPSEQIATVALGLYSNPVFGLLVNLIAVLAMFTSFLTLGTALVGVYNYDYGLSRNLSLVLTFALPLAILLFDLATFITVLGLTGAISGGLDGIMIILMYWKAKKIGRRKPEYSLGKHRVLGTALIIMLALGIVYELFSHFY